MNNVGLKGVDLDYDAFLCFFFSSLLFFGCVFWVSRLFLKVVGIHDY